METPQSFPLIHALTQFFEDMALPLDSYGL